MKNSKKLFLLFCIMFLISACATITKKEAFSKMYDESPLSILVLPPINVTTAADAKEYYSVTVAEPLSLAGYYVYPIEVTSDILKNEGLYDTELLLKLSPLKFKQYFGADAVLYIKILKWDTQYIVIGGSVTVAVELLLKSTNTGEILWKYSGTITQDTTGDSGAGLIGQIVLTAIQTARTDYVPIAKQVNFLTIGSQCLLVNIIQIFKKIKLI